ncbi:hypothetical protein K7432_005152 [Basidiobolus ranarum]|uniref:DAGKc domain-containing protein n=1 Tax=Basidiobolus ranarum TaxID=34480 RepID=A0ABR2WX12_9FUNG
MLEETSAPIVFDHLLDPFKPNLSTSHVNKQTMFGVFTEEVSYILGKQNVAGHISIESEAISWKPSSNTTIGFSIPYGVAFSVLFTPPGSNFKSLHNCHSYVDSPPSPQFTLFGYRNGNRKSTPEYWSFSCASVEEAELLVEKIRTFLQPPGARKGALRNLLLLLNPASGAKKAISIYQNIVKPMLEMAQVKHTLRQTERPLHAKEIAETYDYSEYDAVATISGDGLLHEFLNGVLSRTDWREATKTSIGIIPAGSGNALAKSVGTPTPELAVANLIIGSTRPLDIMVTKLADDSIRYSFEMATWGYVADVDIESEKLRWAGPARLTIYALLRLLNLRTYEGRIHYIPYDAPVEDIANLKDPENSSKFTHVEDISIPVEGKLAEPWITRECSFSQFFALNIPWISTDFLACKHSRLNSGFIDLVWIEKVPSSKLLQLMIDSAEGSYIDEDFANHIKARAIILEPIGRKSKSNPSNVRKGILDIDGEVVLTGPIRIESLPGICQVVAPSWLDEDENTMSRRKGTTESVSLPSK